MSLFDSQGVGSSGYSADPNTDPMGWLQKFYAKQERPLEDEAEDASGTPEVWQTYDKKRKAEEEFSKYAQQAQAAAAEMAGLVPTKDVRLDIPSGSGAARGMGVSPGLLNDITGASRPAIEEPLDRRDSIYSHDRGRIVEATPGTWTPAGPGNGPVVGSWDYAPGAGADRTTPLQRLAEDVSPFTQPWVYDRQRKAQAQPGPGGAGPMVSSGAGPAAQAGAAGTPAQQPTDPSAALRALVDPATGLPRIETEDLGFGSRRLTSPSGVREWVSDPHKGADGTDYGSVSITSRGMAGPNRGADFLKSGSALLSSPQRFSAGPPAIEAASADIMPTRARYDATGNRVGLAGAGADQSGGHVANVGGGTDWRQDMALEEQRQAAAQQRRAPELTALQERAKLAELHRAIDDPYALERLRASAALNLEGARGQSKIGEVGAKAEAEQRAEKFRAVAYQQDVKAAEEKAATVERYIRSTVPPGPEQDRLLKQVAAQEADDKAKIKTAHELAAQFRTSKSE